MARGRKPKVRVYTVPEPVVDEAPLEPTPECEPEPMPLTPPEPEAPVSHYAKHDETVRALLAEEITYVEFKDRIRAEAGFGGCDKVYFVACTKDYLARH